MPESYLAACAIFRNEAPYLAEWIDFHRLVGVERFFLYDNGSDDGSLAVLAPYIAAGCVSVQPWPMPFRLPAARLAYADCLTRARGHARWLTCIDLDEFLFAPQEPTLIPVLRRFEHCPGVVVRWQVYGSSGHERATDEQQLVYWLDMLEDHRRVQLARPLRLCEVARAVQVGAVQERQELRVAQVVVPGEFDQAPHGGGRIEWQPRLGRPGTPILRDGGRGDWR